MRTALITGGSRGIGAAVAGEFSRQGYKVISPSRAELDLASRESVEAYGASLVGQEIDILVNNAGINFLSGFEQIADDNWDAMMDVNLNAPRKLLQAVLPAMRSQKWGRVVNISSVFSLVSKAGRTVYSVTKAGLNGLTRTSAIELAPHGILVNAVCPGYVATEMTRANNPASELEKIIATVPVGRLAEPAEIARLVVFLCSEANTYITGQSIVADGGFSLL